MHAGAAGEHGRSHGQRFSEAAQRRKRLLVGVGGMAGAGGQRHSPKHNILSASTLHPALQAVSLTRWTNALALAPQAASLLLPLPLSPSSDPHESSSCCPREPRADFDPPSLAFSSSSHRPPSPRPRPSASSRRTSRAPYLPRTSPSTDSSTGAVCSGEAGDEGPTRGGTLGGGSRGRGLQRHGRRAPRCSSTPSTSLNTLADALPPSPRAEPARRRRQVGLSIRPRPPSPLHHDPLSSSSRSSSAFKRPSRALNTRSYSLDPTSSRPRSAVSSLFPFLSPTSSPSSSCGPTSSQRPHPPDTPDLDLRAVCIGESGSERAWRRRLGRQERDRTRRARGASLCTRSSLCMT